MKRFISLLLSIIMVISIVTVAPIGGQAAEIEVEEKAIASTATASDAGYYIIGLFNGEELFYVDDSSSDRKLRENPDVAGEYILDWTFYGGDELKVVYYDGTEIKTWYKDQADNYKIGADSDRVGTCRVYFNPEGKDEWSYTYFTVIAKADPVDPTDEPTTVDPTDEPTEEPTTGKATAGYYLVGTLNGESLWNSAPLTADRKFKENPAVAGEYMLDWTFYGGDELKVVYYDGTEIKTWYKDQDDNYKIGADSDRVGTCRVYFNPEGKDEWSYTYFTVQPIDDPDSGDYTYTILSDGTAEITGYTGQADVLYIPSTIDGYTVTSIGAYAFSECQSLTEVTIPDTVTTIGEYAFYCSDSLVKVTIPENVTSIGDYAFFETSLTEIIIPKSVTSIGTGAISSCITLETVVVDSDNPVYDSRDNCNAVIETATNTLVQGCSSTTIPDTVTSIGIRAFLFCDIETIAIPASVTSIGFCAFHGCQSLNKITIYNPDCDIYDDTTTIYRGVTIYGYEGSTAQEYAQKLYRPFVSLGEDPALDYSYRVLDNGTAKITSYKGSDSVMNIPSDIRGYTVTDIGEKAFLENESITEVTIPDTVINIGDQAFSECDNLTKANIPDSVSDIGYRMFYCCYSLAELTIPDSVTSIGSHAFYSCYSLTDFSIPDSVTSIGDYAFCGCDSLTEVTIPEHVTSIGSFAFYNCDSIAEITIPASVTSIGTAVLAGCSQLSSITVDSDNPVYDSRDNCNAIIETASNTLEHGCQSTNIPESVTSIGNHAFYFVTELIEITIPDTVVSVDGLAFYGCDNITEITIPKSVTSIGEDAFGSCGSLAEISILNPDCGIYDHSNTINSSATICGYDDSTAQAYAIDYDRKFVSLGLPPIEEGQEYTVSVGDDEYANLKFVPTKSGYYVFESYDNSGDPYGYVYDSDNNELDHDDDSGDGNNFKMTCYLVAGNTYTCKIRGYGNLSVTCKFSVTYEPFELNVGNDYTLIMAQNETMELFFTPSTSGFYSISSSAASGVDPRCYLYEGDQRIAYNDDYIVRNFSLNEYLRAGHTYRYEIDSYYGDAQTVPIRFDYGASVLAYDKSYVFDIAQDQTLTLSFTADKSGFYRLYSQDSTGDPLAYLYDSDGNILKYSDDHLESSEFFVQNYLIEGKTYTYKIRGYNNNSVTVPATFIYVGQTVSHQTAVEEGYDATCTETGVTDRVYCSVCGEVFEDHEVIPAKGHMIRETVSGYDATCEETGLTDGEKCLDCGEMVVEQQIIPAKGHGDIGGILGYDATCEETGLTMGEYCTVCDKILVPQEVIPALGHTVVVEEGYEATCESAGLSDGEHCLVCNKVLVHQEVIPPLGHTTVVDRGYSATCESAGLSDGEHCSVCNKVLVNQEVIPPLGHTRVTEYGYDATCENAGRTDCEYCSTCRKVFVEWERIPALGHTNVVDKGYDATCEETGLSDGEHCSVCEKVLVAQEIIPALGHKEVVEKGYDATCESAGLTDNVYCSVCEKVIANQEVIPPLGHTTVVDRGYSATCESAGLSDGEHCSVCNKVLVDQVVIPPLGHTKVVDNGYAATCENEGRTQGEHCSTCNKVFVIQEVIPALGHTKVVDKGYAATCESNGLSDGEHCSTCNKLFKAQEIIVALGHTKVSDRGYSATCESAGLSDGEHCLTCNKVFATQEVIPPLGHTKVVDKGCAATCETEGRTQGEYCSTCKKVFVTQEVIPALGHTVVVDKGYAATCDRTGLADGEHCSTCNKLLKPQEIILALGHSYTESVIEPDCTHNGYTLHECIRCDKSYESDVVSALGHNEVPMPDVPASCVEPGRTGATHCSRCEIIINEGTVTEKGKHSIVCDNNAVPATCTESGLTDSYSCKYCGMVNVKQRTIQPLGHDYQKFDGYPATDTEEGLSDGVGCVNCGDMLIEQTVIPAKGVLLGDVNDDKGITVMDATMVQRHIAKLVTLSGRSFKAGDTTKDGNITVMDATAIQRYIAKLIGSF